MQTPNQNNNTECCATGFPNCGLKGCPNCHSEVKQLSCEKCHITTTHNCTKDRHCDNILHYSMIKSGTTKDTEEIIKNVLSPTDTSEKEWSCKWCGGTNTKKPLFGEPQPLQSSWEEELKLLTRKYKLSGSIGILTDFISNLIERERAENECSVVKEGGEILFISGRNDKQELEGKYLTIKEYHNFCYDSRQDVLSHLKEAIEKLGSIKYPESDTLISLEEVKALLNKEQT